MDSCGSIAVNVQLIRLSFWSIQLRSRMHVIVDLKGATGQNLQNLQNRYPYELPPGKHVGILTY